MPKFNKQNKKRIDPRYFLEETIEKDVLEEGSTGFCVADSDGHVYSDSEQGNRQCRGASDKHFDTREEAEAYVEKNYEDT
jgi:hypothetical protein